MDRPPGADEAATPTRGMIAFQEIARLWTVWVIEWGGEGKDLDVPQGDFVALMG